MKVLIAHNRYQSASPSGENRVVDAEIALLERGGVEVVPYLEDSDELAGRGLLLMGAAAAGPVISPRAIVRLRRLIEIHHPDVVHVHNVFPLISPWVVRTAARLAIPVVQTVHNYRHTCIAGSHFRQGGVCEDCTDRSIPWPSVAHGCYRGSRVQSAAMAVGQVAHRSTWRSVSRYLTTSPLMEGRLVSIGVAPERIEWRPTFAEDAGASPLPPEGGLAFLGRLDRAKGVGLLLDAWTPSVAERWGRLVIGGSGPMESLVRARSQANETIHFAGKLDAEGVRRVMREARAVALPSLWFEGFPRVAAEAMSLGRPLLMWEGSGFSQLAKTGAGWALGATPQAWSSHLLALDETSLAAAARAARRFFEAHCSPDTSLGQLQRVYHSVVHGALA